VKEAEYNIISFSRDQDLQIPTHYQPAISELFQVIFPTYSQEQARKHFTEAIGNWSVVLLALHADTVIGFGVISKLDKRGEIELEYAAVREEYRGKGVYTNLLIERIAIAREMNTPSIYIYTTNEIIVPLLERFGFEMEFDPEKYDGYIYKKFL